MKNCRVDLFTVLLSGLRHRWLVYLRARYTRVSLRRRKGACRVCGRCCLLNKPSCRYFQNGSCLVYRQQPFFCRIFPIDRKDQRMSGVASDCGYYWDS